MQIKNYLLITGTVLLLSGCVEIDLLSIEVNEDLSSNVQIVVSPPGTAEERSQKKEELSQTEEELSLPAEEPFLDKATEEFEKCGFEVLQNLRYDSEGVSGSQSFYSRTDFERAMNCLSYFSGQEPLVQVAYPTKSENLSRSTYKLRVDVKNADLYTVYSDTDQLVKEVQVSLPGKIVRTKIENQIPLSLLSAETTSELAIFQIKKLGTAESVKETYELLGVDLSNVDALDIDLSNQEESGKFFEEVSRALQEQLDPEIYQDTESFSEYYASKVKPYTTIVIESTKSKIGIDTTTTIILGALPILGSVIVFFYSRGKKKS
jgi:hypothetical protein